MSSMSTDHILNTIEQLQYQIMQMTDQMAASAASGDGTASFFMIGLTVFTLACFVGYYVIWNVTPALHSPLMSVSNAISGIVIVGALIAAGTETTDFAKWMGFVAVTLASINIFGGFAVTDRMLALFKTDKKKKAEGQ